MSELFLVYMFACVSACTCARRYVCVGTWICTYFACVFSCMHVVRVFVPARVFAHANMSKRGKSVRMCPCVRMCAYKCVARVCMCARVCAC